MTYVYVAINNKGLIKIGSTIDPADRQKRFNAIAKHHKNSGMIIQKAVALKYDGRAYEWAIESLLRYDLSTYNTSHKTMDTFAYNGAYFKPKAYIKTFEDKVAKAERIIGRIKTTGHLL